MPADFKELLEKFKLLPNAYDATDGFALYSLHQLNISISQDSNRKKIFVQTCKKMYLRGYAINCSYMKRISEFLFSQHLKIYKETNSVCGLPARMFRLILLIKSGVINNTSLPNQKIPSYHNLIFSWILAH